LPDVIGQRFGGRGNAGAIVFIACHADENSRGATKCKA
jgi:hypothetical protein